MFRQRRNVALTVECYLQVNICEGRPSLKTVVQLGTSKTDNLVMFFAWFSKRHPSYNRQKSKQKVYLVSGFPLKSAICSALQNEMLSGISGISVGVKKKSYHLPPLLTVFIILKMDHSHKRKSENYDLYSNVTLISSVFLHLFYICFPSRRQ